MLSGGSITQARLRFARMQWVVAVLAALLIGAAGRFSHAFELKSPAFTAEGEIPARHTCDGADVSPPLRWVDSPAGTKAFALIVDDPDAPGGTWVHWVLYEMSPEARELLEGVSSRDTVAGIGRQGTNDFKRVGYGGPCPPKGPAHRYVFRLYALDGQTDLPPRKNKADVLKAIEGHVLGQAELVGRYQRR